MAKLHDSPTDPLYCNTDGGNGATYQMQIPSGATESPPFGSTTGFFDGHMGILDANGSTLWEFYGAAKQSDGSFKASRLFKNRIKGDGWSGFRCYHASRASGASALGGLVRAGELTNGIKHALAITVGAAQMNRYGGSGKGYKWPAIMTDADQSEWGTTGNVYYGTLLAIPASVNLDAIQWNTVQGKNIAKALQLYGAYVVDGMSGGPKAVFKMEYSARAEMPSQSSGTPFKLDLIQARRLLRVIGNNGSNSVGGGGTPLAPLAPSFTSTSSSGRHDGRVVASVSRSPQSEANMPLLVVTVALLPARRLWGAIGRSP
jgi:hypothetical protein